MLSHSEIVMLSGTAKPCSRNICF